MNKKTTIQIICVGLVLAVFIVLLGHFVTNSVDVVVQNPTEEQIMALYDYSGDTNRVWVVDVDKIYGENSLVKIKMLIRRSEYPDKIVETLKYAGITDNYALGSLRME